MYSTHDDQQNVLQMKLWMTYLSPIRVVFLFCQVLYPRTKREGECNCASFERKTATLEDHGVLQSLLYSKKYQVWEGFFALSLRGAVLQVVSFVCAEKKADSSANYIKSPDCNTRGKSHLHGLRLRDPRVA